MLKDKVALVTGASRGIGREIAQTLAAYGASVIVNYNGSKDRADEVVEMISAAGGKAIAVKADVAKAEEIARLFEEAQAAFGRIDILVNNAGITRDNLILKMSEEEYDTDQRYCGQCWAGKLLCGESGVNRVDKVACEGTWFARDNG